MKRIQLVLFTLCCLFWLAHPSVIDATVLINEVFPSPSDGPEWIELYNKGPEPITLTGWTLEDVLSSPSTMYTFSQLEMAPLSWLLVELPSAKLNNAADGLTLKNEAGEIMDTMTYNSSAPNQTWARIPDGTGQFFLTHASKGTTNGNSPPAPSPTPSPTPTPSPSPSASPITSPSSSPLLQSYPFLSISEIMACPVSGDAEWLELYNASNSPVEINSWQVRDFSGTSKSISARLPANAYSVVSWSGSLLNNSGDMFTLLTDQNVSVDAASFSACNTGQSFVLHKGTWQATATVTKGSANPDVSTQLTDSFSDDGTETNSDNTPIPTNSPSIEVLSPATTLTPPNLDSTVKALPSAHLASLSATLANLQLDTLARHPISSPSATIDLSRSLGSKWGVVNVILGGALLLASGSYLIHENYFGSN